MGDGDGNGVLIEHLEFPERGGNAVSYLGSTKLGRETRQ